MKHTKKTLFILTFICAFICVDHIYSQCKVKQITKSCKPNIDKPYKYDSYAVNEFTFDKKDKNIEVQFTAFQGQKYKIVFCSSGFQEAVKMNIYDKSNRVKKGRNQIYDGSQKGLDSDFWSFEPPKSGNYYINYAIPPSLDTTTVKKGCIVMLIGYAEQE